MSLKLLKTLKMPGLPQSACVTLDIKELMINSKPSAQQNMISTREADIHRCTHESSALGHLSWQFELRMLPFQELTLPSIILSPQIPGRTLVLSWFASQSSSTILWKSSNDSRLLKDSQAQSTRTAKFDPTWDHESSHESAHKGPRAFSPRKAPHETFLDDCNSDISAAIPRVR